MGSLADALNNMYSSDLSHMGMIYRGSLATGFKHLDYVNSKRNLETGEIEQGVSAGKIIYIAGNSGSGKSSLAIKIARNIIADDDDGLMWLFDAEKSNSHERIADVAGIERDEYVKNWKEKRIHLINVGTSVDNLYDLVNSIHRTKMTCATGTTYNKKEGFSTKDSVKTREEASSLPPSVIIVDSWAMLAPKKIDADGEGRGAMDAAQIAKANNSFIKQVADRLYEANITFIIINHITTDIQIGPVQTDERPIKWLKPKEKLPGGNTAIYLADTLLRMEQKSALSEEKDFGIHGFYVEVTLGKSRNNASGFKFMAVLNPYIGIDSTLSDYVALKNSDYIGGSGRSFFLKNAPDIKFAQRDITTLFKTNANFRKAFNQAVRECYSSSYLKDVRLFASDGEQSDDEGSMEYTAAPVPSSAVVAKMTKAALKEFIAEQGLDIDPADYVLTELRVVVAEALEEKAAAQGNDGATTGNDHGEAPADDASEGMPTEEEFYEIINAAEDYDELNALVERCGYEAFSEDDYTSLDAAKQALADAVFPAE